MYFASWHGSNLEGKIYRSEDDERMTLELASPGQADTVNIIMMLDTSQTR